MDTKELQKLARKVGGLVVIENDKPAFVILNYDKFSELSGIENPLLENPEILDEDFQESFTGEMLKADLPAPAGNLLPEDEAVEELNKEVMALAEEIENKEKNL